MQNTFLWVVPAQESLFQGTFGKRYFTRPELPNSMRKAQSRLFNSYEIIYNFYNKVKESRVLKKYFNMSKKFYKLTFVIIQLENTGMLSLCMQIIKITLLSNVICLFIDTNKRSKSSQT